MVRYLLFIFAMWWSSSSYTITRILYETERILICSAIRKSDQASVILKVLRRARQRPRDVERFKNAYEIGIKVNDSSVVKTLALEENADGLVLVFEDGDSISLEAQLSTSISLKSFLRLAVKISDAIAKLHSKNVVHCDIKPQNILIDPKTDAIKLADLELAAFLPREQQIMPNPWLMEASLPYMSPEQTGKTNHAIDTRSDLYSAGITFYQLWLGRLPFQAEDPLGWIYNHLTTTPPSLFNIKPQTPVVLSEIVDKLLEKDPNNRYHSALGLKYDLEKCLENLTADGAITTFKLGEKDISDRFQIPQKLYGREKEISQLLEIFDRVITTGKPELILVSGYSGVGKTSLIRELHKPLVKKRGFFLTGKFDQYKRGIPYSTLSQAFRNFVLELLTEPEEQINYWRKQIKEALGDNAQLMIDLIPEVEAIIGPQPAAPEAQLGEAENRFRMVFRQFLGVFANEQHPVVLVLDDLQWADQASLKFISDILTNDDMKYFLLIGAFRDNEVTPSHPLTLAVTTLRQEQALVSELVLHPLAYEHLAQLISEAMHKSLKEVDALAHLIYGKTAGNPFFFIQLLIALHQERSIYFDTYTQSWSWNLEEIREKKQTDNVVDLILERLRKLPARAQDTLALAACVGNVFNSETLTMIAEQSEEDIRADLWEGINEGLILRIQTEYKFSHDRIQQAATSLLSEKQRQQTHLKIGRQWLAHTTSEQLLERIFDIANQLNQGISLIDNKDEREQLAWLNLKAAQKARQAAAYDPAVAYLNAGMSLLTEDTWKKNYDLNFALHLERVQSEYLNKNFELAEKYFSILISYGRNRLELAAVYGIGIQLYTNKAEPGRAINMALEYLKLFDIILPEKPTIDHVTNAVQKIMASIKDRTIESFVDLPIMTDPEQKALLSIILVALPATYVTNDKLWALFACEGVRLSLEYGNSENSSLAYSTLSMVLGAFFQRYQEGYRFGQLAIELANRYPKEEATNAAVYITCGTMVIHWVKPFKLGTPYIRKGFQAAVESGNQTWACYGCNLLISAMLSEGLPLNEIQHESENSFDFVSRAKFQTQMNGVATNQFFIQRMRGIGTIDEKQQEANLLAVPWPVEICWFYIRQMQASFIFGEYEEALRFAKKAAPMLWTSSNFVQVADFAFFNALLLAQLGQKEEMQEYIQQLEIWAQNSPENFTDRLNLVLAEVARLDEKFLEAEYYYEKAIQAAKKNGFNHTEALGYELAAKFYSHRDFSTTAEAYLQEARACYIRWGANAKVKDLEQKYHLVRQKIGSSTEAETFTAKMPDLDFYSVIKASQTISGKILASDLSRTLLNVMMEHAGAQRGSLILFDEGQLKIEAISNIDSTGIHVDLLSQQLLAGSTLVPEAIIQYVVRTGDRVILADASQNAGLFKNNEYIKKQMPRSVLCLPILRQLKPVGYLYLENTLVSGVFTQDRLAVLELLASQSAISIENARLLSHELLARQNAEKEKHKIAFLAEAGKLLSESLEYEQVLENLAQLVTRQLADWCEFDMIEDGEIHRRAGSHVNPKKFDLLKELARRYPPSWDSPHPSMKVLQTKKVLLLSEISPEKIKEYTVDAEHAEIIRGLGTKELISVPLQTPRRVLGVLTIASEKNVHYGQDDLSLVQELAKQASIAIDNALLYREAQNAIQLREDFISIASHELKTPITPLKMQIQLLRSFMRSGFITAGPKGHELLKLIEKSDRQISRLSKLVDNMFDISRIATGRLTLNFEKTDLAELTRNAVENFRSDLAAAHCETITKIDSPIYGEWDKFRIEQVAANLISNAIKYGAGKPIKISVFSESNMAVLSVQDFGIGIAKEDQARIFNRFERAVSVKHFGGLGLGLYITHEIVESHGGQISLESVLGEGTTVTVKLPFTVPASKIQIQSQIST